MVVLLATGNRGKLQELTHIFAGSPVDLRLPQDAGVRRPDVDESGDTYLENALRKAAALAAVSGQPALADDSGLEVDALGGAPGIRSARFAGGDVENVRRLLAELKDARNRRARFRCVLALVKPAGARYLAEGCLEGEIAPEPRGTAGFGYDPVFLLPPLGKTLAELSFAEKQTMSHRARAAERLKKLLATSA